MREKLGAHLVSILIIIGATACQTAISPFVSTAPYLLFYPAVLLAARYGHGLTGVVAASLLSTYFFVPPFGSIVFESRADLLRWIVFVFSSLLIARLSLRARVAERSSEEALGAIEASHQAKVLERGRLEAVLKQMPEGVVIADAQGRLDLRNEQMDALLGGFLQCDSIEEYGKFKGFRPDGSPYAATDWPLARAVRSGEVVSQEEIELERLDGSRAILSISARPVRDETGKIIAAVATHRDVTAEKRARERLRASEQHYRELAEALPHMVFVCDASGVPTYFNHRWVERTGRSLESLQGTGWTQALHELDRSEVLRDWGEAVREGRPYEGEYRVFTADGSYRWHLARAIPVREAGRIAGWFGTATDIHDQKRSQLMVSEALTERDRSIQALATVNEVGQRLVAELDLQRLVQTVTDAATKLTGAEFGAFFYNVIDGKGKSYTLYTISGVPREAFSKFPMPRATKVFAPTFEGVGTVRSDDIRADPRYGKNAPYHGMPAGHLPVVSYLAVPVISRSGEVIGGLFFGHGKPAVFSDQVARVAEGLAAQAAVAMDNARLYQRVQESVRARDDFLSIASHELKTPLTSLKLQTQIRERYLNRGEMSKFSPEKLRAMLKADSIQVERLTHLVDDMLDISRIGTGKLHMKAERFDLGELASEIVERYRPQLEASGSSISVEAAAGIIGEWDRFRVEQVLANLLTNAMKYGNGKPVRVRVWREGAEAKMSVRDQGIGVAREHQERIFQRFERAVSASEVSGLGLGLYISRKIVEMHRGSIQVVSEPGQGAEFVVSMPLEGGLDERADAAVAN